MSARARHVDLREACVAEAMRIVGAEGVETLSLREVARRLGVSHQAPYKHFASRDHIVAEMVRRAFDHFAAALDARARGDGPGEDCLAMGRAYITYALEHPLYYRLMFGAPLPDAASHPEMMHSARHAFSLLRDALERLFAERGIAANAEELDLESLFVWSTLHGLVSLLRTQALGGRELAQDAQAALAARVVTRLAAALGAISAKEEGK